MITVYFLVFSEVLNWSTVYFKSSGVLKSQFMATRDTDTTWVLSILQVVPFCHYSCYSRSFFSRLKNIHEIKKS